MYPTATVPERFADGFMHLIGVAGAIYLLNIGALAPQLAIYGPSLIVAFIAASWSG